MALDMPDDEKQVIDEMFGLRRELWDEVQILVGATSSKDQPSPTLITDHKQRRGFVRAVFAYIEGMAYRLKQFVLVTHKSALDQGEQMICAESAFELDSQGNVERRSARLRFSPNLRFALTICPKAVGSHYRTDFGDGGWDATRNAAKTRDRLVHPKRVADLSVSDAEMAEAYKAAKWVDAEIDRILKAVLLAIRLQEEALTISDTAPNAELVPPSA
jgi:hypothetical protein